LLLALKQFCNVHKLLRRLHGGQMEMQQAVHCHTIPTLSGGPQMAMTVTAMQMSRLLNSKGRHLQRQMLQEYHTEQRKTHLQQEA
jgi:hypothetical protein